VFRRAVLILWCAGVLWWGGAPPAQAYLDPATTSYLLQVISALIVTLSLAVGVSIGRFRTGLLMARSRLGAWWRRHFTAAGRAGARTVAVTAPEPLLEPELQAAVAAVLAASTSTGSASVRTTGAQTWRQKLFADDRAWRRRLPAALVASFGLALPLLCTGPIELYVVNAFQLPFGWRPLLWSAIITAVVVGAALGFAVSALRGRVYDLAVCLLVGVGLASWIQSLFLNLRVGTFIGDQFPWNRYLGQTLLDGLAWAVLIGLVLGLRYLNPKLWRKAVIAVPAVIMLVSVVAAISAGLSLGPSWSGQTAGTGRYLSVAGLDQVSSTNNIIVFLVDTTDESVIASLDQASDFSFAPLDGFTSFDQNVGRYQETFPALPFMFTGQDYLWDQPRSSYYSHAWGASPFFPQLKSLGYTVNLYSSQEDLYWSPDEIAGLVDNLSPAQPHLDYAALMGGMARLSAFGRAPLALQPSLWLDPTTFTGVLLNQSDLAAPYRVDDAELYQQMLSHPLTVAGPDPRFTFIHLFGSHQPFTMDANAQRLQDSQTTRIDQTKGVFRIIYTYLDQLRALGLYESSTILIMADHGTHLPWEQRTLNTPLLPCLMVKPAGAAGTPLQHSLAPTYMTNFAPTIIQAAGGDPAPYGQTYFQVPVDAVITRRFYWIRPATGTYTGELQVFDITGDARDLANWYQGESLPMPGGWIK